MSESKKIRQFKSGAVRSDNSGRPKPHWVSPYGIEEISMVLVENANDFGSLNYLLGIDEEACLESLDRHVQEAKEALLIRKDVQAFRRALRSCGFNAIAGLHTLVLKEKGLYKEIHEKTELIEMNKAVEEDPHHYADRLPRGL